MKSICFVFISLSLNALCFAGNSRGATQSLSINLDGTQTLRFAQTEHEGVNNLDSERTESIVNSQSELSGLRFNAETHYLLGKSKAGMVPGNMVAAERPNQSRPDALPGQTGQLATPSIKGGDEPCTPLLTQGTSNRAEPVLSVPARVEAFYSLNQTMLQDWKVGYDNSLFVRLDQPGFISCYFSILRARNLIVP